MSVDFSSEPDGPITATYSPLVDDDRLTPRKGGGGKGARSVDLGDAVELDDRGLVNHRSPAPGAAEPACSRPPRLGARAPSWRRRTRPHPLFLRRRGCDPLRRSHR